MIGLVALLACAPTPAPEGAVVRDGRRWGTLRREDVEHGARWTLTGDGVTTVEAATLDADGRLATYEAVRDGGARVVLMAEGLYTAVTYGGVSGGGRLELPGAPLWIPAGGPALAAWKVGATDLVWDGRRVVQATLTSRATTPDGLRLAGVDPDGPWSVVLDEGLHVRARTWPDGGAWALGESPDLPVVTPADLVHPAPALPDARRLRRLVVRLPDGREATVARPLWEEVPAVPPPGLPVPEPTAIPDVLPLDLDLPDGLDGKALVVAAFDAVRADAAPSDDCKALAWRLAGALRAEGLDAAVVTGLVFQATPTPRFVHHAWVRVPLGDVALDVDPALGQRVADATHLDGLGELPPGAPVEVLEAVGPEGPVVVETTP